MALILAGVPEPPGATDSDSGDDSGHEEAAQKLQPQVAATNGHCTVDSEEQLCQQTGAANGQLQCQLGTGGKQLQQAHAANGEDQQAVDQSAIQDGGEHGTMLQQEALKRSWQELEQAHAGGRSNQEQLQEQGHNQQQVHHEQEQGPSQGETQQQDRRQEQGDVHAQAQQPQPTKGAGRPKGRRRKKRRNARAAVAVPAPAPGTKVRHGP